MVAELACVADLIPAWVRRHVPYLPPADEHHGQCPGRRTRLALRTGTMLGGGTFGCFATRRAAAAEACRCPPRLP